MKYRPKLGVIVVLITCSPGHWFDRNSLNSMRVRDEGPIASRESRWLPDAKIHAIVSVPRVIRICLNFLLIDYVFYNELDVVNLSFVRGVNHRPFADFERLKRANMPPPIEVASVEAFQKAALQNLKTIAFFWAHWSEPCSALTEVFEDVSSSTQACCVRVRTCCLLSCECQVIHQHVIAYLSIRQELPLT
jgi:hypothetical protein